MKLVAVTDCGFAYPGTFGHECGKVAKFVGVKNSEATQNKVFFAGRCEEHRNTNGGENSDVLRFEPIDQSKHVNQF